MNKLSRFETYHSRHPEVMEELVKLARAAKAKGQTKTSIAMLFEVVRWERIISGLPDEREKFKLSNDFKPYYARRIMSDYPDLEGIFNIKQMWTT